MLIYDWINAVYFGICNADQDDRIAVFDDLVEQLWIIASLEIQIS